MVLQSNWFSCCHLLTAYAMVANIDISIIMTTIIVIRPSSRFFPAPIEFCPAIALKRFLDGIKRLTSNVSLNPNCFAFFKTLLIKPETYFVFAQRLPKRHTVLKQLYKYRLNFNLKYKNYNADVIIYITVAHSQHFLM